jgi:hypothetical protein
MPPWKVDLGSAFYSQVAAAITQILREATLPESGCDMPLRAKPVLLGRYGFASRVTSYYHNSYLCKGAYHRPYSKNPPAASVTS